MWIRVRMGGDRITSADVFEAEDEACKFSGSTMFGEEYVTTEGGAHIWGATHARRFVRLEPGRPCTWFVAFQVVPGSLFRTVAKIAHGLGDAKRAGVR